MGSPVIVPAILAGGRGSRLWPLSSAERPKQFLALNSERTLLQETLLRVADPAHFAPPIIGCHERYGALAAEQARAVSDAGATLILEPEPKNSAPAAAAAAQAALSQDPDALVLIMPADHVIRETALFRQITAGATEAAKRGRIVTFGIAPTRPETGYGYIRCGEPLGYSGAFAAEAFVEKPDLATAQDYLATGAYLWNSGMFLFRARDFLEELARLQPLMHEAAVRAVENAARASENGLSTLRLDPAAFSDCPSDSIDFAVMEKTDRAVVCPAALTWSDIGSWDALAAAQRVDAQGNTALGPATLLDCEQVYALSDGVKIAALGLRDLVVVASGDTVLIADRSATQRVREIAERIESAAGREEDRD